MSWAPQNGWSVRSFSKVGVPRQVVFTDASTDVTVDVTCGGSGPVFDVHTSASSPSPTPTTTPTPSPTPSATVSVPGQP